MKNTCRCELRTYMSQRLAETRREQHLSQAKFSPNNVPIASHARSFSLTLTAK